MTQQPSSAVGAPDRDRLPGAPPLTRFVQHAVRRVRAFDRRRPMVWDLLLTGFFVVAALVDASGGWRNTARNTDLPVWLVVLMSLGLSVPLLWRRRRPMAALALIAPVAFVNGWSGAMLQAALIQHVVVFNIALRLRPKVLWGAMALVATPNALAAFRYPQGSWDQQIVPGLWTFTLVSLLGIVVRTRQEYTASLVERARQLEIERDQQARLAAAAERTRIAREMHDIIGHNLSVITGLADGGAYAAVKSPERAVQALDAIAGTSRQALGELRRLLDVLREEPTATAELLPQPALTDLDRLVEGVVAAGLPVTVTVEGSPGGLPAGRQLTVYRVVQEALTNTLKHAGPRATATVEVSYGDGVAVTVTDTGRGGTLPGARGAGRGLTGMRERTALYDGTLEAGPLPQPPGGWRVHLRLPKDTTL
ncbi:sensor histidine kinase [Streptomyces sp. SP18CS02]|uniref:sensor histidine kinase n=1 Tax=Streptomyces sp. SP18CS02 TaxID=3002531 RepID=UPI002E75A07C|nr:sensor histidine kinase [Streptomyces sp. SP18CS02]MEE1755531.1 sensor histidine kinase [Streptomyces sp. SP18CS02]